MTSPAFGPAPFEPVFTLAAGPAGATPATLAALGQPVLHHYDPAFRELYADTVELMQTAFGTPLPPVILHGEAVLGLEAAAASLIGRDDVVLNLVSGVFGKGYGWWARRYAKEVIEVEVPYDSAVPADAVAAALGERPDVTRGRGRALRDAIGDRERPRRDRPGGRGARRAADRGRGVLVRRRPLRLCGLGRRSRRGRPAEVPGRAARAVAAARQRRCLGAHGGKPGGAAGVDAVDPGLEERSRARPAVPVHALGVRRQRAARVHGAVPGRRPGRGAAPAPGRRAGGTGRGRGARPRAVGGGPLHLLGHGHRGQGARPAG